MAIDPNTSSSTPSDSLPPSLLNPEDMSYFKQPTTPAPTRVASAAPTWTPIAINPNATTTTPPPQQPTPSPTPGPTATAQPAAPPPTAPAVAPPTHLVPPPPVAPPPTPAQPGAAAPAAAPTYIAVGDSLAAGIARAKKFNETYDVNDNPASKANTNIMAASGRTTAQTLSVISANPQQFAGKDVLLSTGMSNDLMAGGSLDDAMTNVASQLDKLRAAGANVALAGVGSGVTGYQQANARLAQLAKAYNIPFTGEPDTTQGGRVHPKDWNAFYGQFHFGEQQPTPGTGKTIDDVTAYIQQKEGGGPFVLYGHEGQSYDPKSMPTKPGYYGFPDWAGGYGPDGRQTHAAGGAQWEPDTWKNAVEGFTQDGLANQLGHTPDFRNPADQKAVFNYWAARRYRELTGRDIVADLNAGYVNWSALGPEWSSLKGAGTGGIAGMTTSNLPGYQDWRRSIEGQRQTLEQESADLQRRMKDLEAGDPQQRALADQLLKKQIQLMDSYETMIAHPPTQKPHDMIANFGSIATLIGIFAGRFAHRPMVASLNAAGAAMQAMNDNDYEAYQNAFKTWKTQTDMTSNLISMESNTYKNIMDDRRLTMDEKFKEMDAAAKIYQNRLLSQQLEAGEYEKAWEYAEKLDKAKDDHALAQAQIEEAHATVEQKRAEAQFPLLGKGEERSDLMAELAKEAQDEAKNPKPGQTPRTVEELAQDPDAVQAARARIELRKAHKDPDEVQSPLIGSGEEKAAIVTELTKQAQAEVAKSSPNATPAEKQAAIKQRVQELANDGAAVDKARQTAQEQKSSLRFGPPITDEQAAVRAGQFLQGDPTALTRMSEQDRNRVIQQVMDMVMPQMLSQFQQQEGHAPSDAEKRNLLKQVGVELASAHAEFTGFTQYMRTLAIRQATIDTAIQEAQNVIPRALAASDKVGRSRFPLLNEAINLGKYQTGDPDIVQLVGVTTSLVNIYSRAVAPTGVATDMVRKMATDQLAAIHSPEQYRAAVAMMQMEMDAAQAAPPEVRQRRIEEFQREGPAWKGDTTFLQHGVSGSSGAPTPRGGPTYPAPPPDAIKDLKANPATRDQFDQIFGPGAAARVLGQ